MRETRDEGKKTKLHTSEDDAPRSGEVGRYEQKQNRSTQNSELRKQTSSFSENRDRVGESRRYERTRERSRERGSSDNQRANQHVQQQRMKFDNDGNRKNNKRRNQRVSIDIGEESDAIGRLSEDDGDLCEVLNQKKVVPGIHSYKEKLQGHKKVV